MSQHVPVLIVGAGPTGLLLANLLKLQNIDCQIVEKRGERTLTSNALGIQSRSLELLDDINLAVPFLKFGQEGKHAFIHDKKGIVAKFNLSLLDTPYNFVLMLPQSMTEKLLEENLNKLGTQVARNCTLINAKSDPQKVSVEINTPHGIRPVTCDYIIACDGAHSTLRHLFNIQFTGESIPQHFVVADAHVSACPHADAIDSYFADSGLMAVFPYQANIVRIVAELPDSLANTETLDHSAIKQLVEERSFGEVAVHDFFWLSKFSINTRMTTLFRHERLFLLGDAAHIHSPMGGQGMNTGFQDAYNLSWKLAMVMKQQAKAKLLDSYAAEREPVIKELLNFTKESTKFALSTNKLVRWLRRTMLHRLSQSQKFQQLFARRISQVSIEYRHSPIICYRYQVSKRSPRPGQLIPDVKYLDDNRQPSRLKEKLRGQIHHLLIFTGNEYIDDHQAAIEDIIERIQRHYRDTIKPVIIAHGQFANKFNDNTAIKINDNNLAAHNVYHTTSPSLFLVRPDKYIAYAANNLDAGTLFGFMTNILNAK